MGHVVELVALSVSERATAKLPAVDWHAVFNCSAGRLTSAARRSNALGRPKHAFQLDHKSDDHTVQSIWETELKAVLSATSGEAITPKQMEYGLNRYWANVVVYCDVGGAVFSQTCSVLRVLTKCRECSMLWWAALNFEDPRALPHQRKLSQALAKCAVAQAVVDRYLGLRKGCAVKAMSETQRVALVVQFRLHLLKTIRDANISIVESYDENKGWA